MPGGPRPGRIASGARSRRGVHMKALWAAPAVLLIVVVLWDAFETIVLPRRVTRKIRLTRLFYHVTWRIWLAVGRSLVAARSQQAWLSFFGPISLLLLLSVWAS